MTTTQANGTPSTWQDRITGEWYGMPSIFDGDGTHLGYNKVSRASVFEGNRTTYWMDTQLEATGWQRADLEFTNFEFGVIDSDRDRIYLGPDFIGAGHPYGALVDANYYSPAWRSDLRTMVHILPDGETQVYSSLLFRGPTVYSVFNGLYLRATDYDSNTETQARIAAHIEDERSAGQRQHMLPPKHRGMWSGEMAVYDTGQEQIGVNRVMIAYEPLTLLRARMTLTIEGVINKQVTFERERIGTLHTFDGPDLYGNGMGFGRALWTRQHFFGEAFKISGREFLIDEDHTLSTVWQFYQSDVAAYTTFGVLTWQPEGEAIRARYAGRTTG